MNTKINRKEISNITRIQGTNDNSILSKCSMIKYGYFKDDFLPFMIGKFSRRAPLINRGYYIRAKAIEYTLLSFINNYQNKQFQIISLGAGFDTSFFRLKSEGKLENCTFIEIDYFDVAQRKANLIQQESCLWNCLSAPGTVSVNQDNYIIINATNYKLIGIDLTKLDILDACIRASGVSYELPTLFLSECVITYISTKKSSNLLRFIAKSFVENCFVLYEQIYPDDSFGRFMCLHFKQLGSSLRGITTFKNKEDQINRFLNAGWDSASGCDMSEFYYNIVDSLEKSKIENLEVFDEYEEWLLKCNHYLVLVACKGMGDWNPAISRHESQKHITDLSPLNFHLEIKPYQSDSTELFKNGGVKTHYVKADMIYHMKNNNRHEYLLRVSGYGQNPFSSGHCRLSCVSILDLETDIMTHIEPARSDLLLNTLCGSMSRISDNQFILFGGRSSPLKPNNIATILQLNYDDTRSIWSAECTELIIDETSKICQPSPRWRHIAGVYWVNGQPRLLIAGGRNSLPRPLSDTFVLDISSRSWRKVHCGDSPGSVCSASVISIGTGNITCTNRSSDRCCGCCCLLVFGGLRGDELMPSSDLWRWCGRLEQWQRINTEYIMSRFSHTSHVLHQSGTCSGGGDGDGVARIVTFVSLGGVSHVSPCCGISLISVDLSCNQAHSREFPLDTNVLSECAMFHNHGSALSDVSKKLWIVGGGGNCFSFGTQLNENIYSIDFNNNAAALYED